MRHARMRCCASLMPATCRENLYLVSQVLELGLPVVLALNMTDVAKQRGLSIDVRRLAEKLGVPVVELQANRRRGIDELKSRLAALTKENGAAPRQPIARSLSTGSGEAGRATERCRRAIDAECDAANSQRHSSLSGRAAAARHNRVSGRRSCRLSRRLVVACGRKRRARGWQKRDAPSRRSKRLRAIAGFMTCSKVSLSSPRSGPSL